MQITDLLQSVGGLDSIARDLNIDPQQANAGAAALLPAILGGFQKQAQAGGAEGIGGLLAQLGGGSLMDQVLAPEPTNVAPGNAVLGQIFGSPDVSRTVAQSAASQTGIDPALLKKMLPLLAMLVSGFMARNAGAGAAQAEGGAGGLGGMLGGVLGSLLGGGQAGAAGGGLGGLGALGGLLEPQGERNALDEILASAGRPRP